MSDPQWEACKVCGGDHWTTHHGHDPRAHQSAPTPRDVHDQMYLEALDGLWAEMLLDACASDGPIRDADVRTAIARYRPKIEDALIAAVRAEYDDETLVHPPDAWAELERQLAECREPLDVEVLRSAIHAHYSEQQGGCYHGSLGPSDCQSFADELAEYARLKAER